MIWKEVINGLAGKIRNSKGVSVFVKNESKFENWLQVELCGLLAEKEYDVCPEKKIPGVSKSVDICFDVPKKGKYACELKVVLVDGRVRNHTASSTLDTIQKDIEKLRGLPQEFRGFRRCLIFLIVSYIENIWQTEGQENKFNVIVGNLNNVIRIEENNNGTNFKLFFGEVA